MGQVRKFKFWKGQKTDAVRTKLSEDIIRIRKDHPDGYLMIWKREGVLKTYGSSGFSPLELLGAIEALKFDLMAKWE